MYLKVPIEECYQVTGKGPLGLKWIDINKGDDEFEQYKSRLVAKEIKFDKREDLFAPTPPLESIKILLSLAVTDLCVSLLVMPGQWSCHYSQPPFLI